MTKMSNEKENAYLQNISHSDYLCCFESNGPGQLAIIRWRLFPGVILWNGISIIWIILQENYPNRQSKPVI